MYKKYKKVIFFLYFLKINSILLPYKCVFEYKKNIRFVTVKYKKVTFLYSPKKREGGGEAKKKFEKKSENKKIISWICKNRIGILSFFWIMNDDTVCSKQDMLIHK